MSIRPLKCNFCWRRYKYEACLKHHMQQSHSELIKVLLYRQNLQILSRLTETIEAHKEDENSEENQQPQRASVIRCKSQLEQNKE